ncbi:DNA integration/recombination/inversion protein [Bacillus cereus BAG1X2-3]|jgi:integrase|uniref:tyrosine-type recombinase/integrase n=1 Tax=Bacillus cereus TaxID=1396 RepID=UPI00032E32C2|nr:tyrosine-type recombinase/integrase [Bacillus cereus]EOO24845.1 DNA integration/recombination/inversion protein [Bacillus cereus BAG1X1-1]EOO44329.1 DNA integration/recombination/inversion protein [Bacillus cereus BAG1X2-1]EOO46135.1 DNA integration/recombination/inversion protein [Bacillus cereus BAG1X2-2]EOO62582.1 DNA integration/recombination/inversion protein [Bacillus cereus BAG1X2-3]EOP01612.1 DNA integration/recombination/inversion protein [Bacillus cereus BAG2O-1]
MNGSVKKDKKTGKDLFIVDIGIDPLTGKRKQKKKRGFITKQEAENALTMLLSEVHTGTYVEPSKLSYGEYLQDWFNTKKHSVGIQTAKVLKGYLNSRIIPSLGNIKLDKLTSLHMQNYVNSLRDEGLKRGTIEKIIKIIRNSLEHAIDMELITKNVAAKTKLPKSDKEELTIWNEQEVQLFLKATQDSRYSIVFHMALVTGMRQGELLGLRWKDVDLEKGHLTISQTLSHDGKMFLLGGKTKSSLRKILLPASTVAKLKKHRAVVLKEKLGQGEEYHDNDLVMCTPSGTPITPANVRRSLNALIKKAAVPKIRFHDLRHTHATLLLAKGVNVKVISERLGHSNIKITLDTYSHVLPTMQEDAVNKIEEIL